MGIETVFITVERKTVCLQTNISLLYRTHTLLDPAEFSFLGNQIRWMCGISWFRTGRDHSPNSKCLSQRSGYQGNIQIC